MKMLRFYAQCFASYEKNREGRTKWMFLCCSLMLVKPEAYALAKAPSTPDQINVRKPARKQTERERTWVNGGGWHTEMARLSPSQRTTKKIRRCEEKWICSRQRKRLIPGWMSNFIKCIFYDSISPLTRLIQRHLLCLLSSIHHTVIFFCRTNLGAPLAKINILYFAEHKLFCVLKLHFPFYAWCVCECGGARCTV